MKGPRIVNHFLDKAVSIVAFLMEKKKTLLRKDENVRGHLKLSLLFHRLNMSVHFKRFQSKLQNYAS